MITNFALQFERYGCGEMRSKSLQKEQIKMIRKERETHTNTETNMTPLVVLHLYFRYEEGEKETKGL